MGQYKDIITEECHKISLNKNTIFIGYNTVCGTRMYHTLDNVDKDKCIETPVAENLMLGLGMGMSLEGYRPIICFERTNFLYAAADAIRHHLCMLPILSGGQFDFPVVLRAITGHDKPLDPGLQHKWGDVFAFAELCNLEYIDCQTIEDIQYAYKEASVTKSPLMIVEHRSLY